MEKWGSWLDLLIVVIFAAQTGIFFLQTTIVFLVQKNWISKRRIIKDDSMTHQLALLKTRHSKYSPRKPGNIGFFPGGRGKRFLQVDFSKKIHTLNN